MHSAGEVRLSRLQIGSHAVQVCGQILCPNIIRIKGQAKLGEGVLHGSKVQEVVIQSRNLGICVSLSGFIDSRKSLVIDLSDTRISCQTLDVFLYLGVGEVCRQFSIAIRNNCIIFAHIEAFGVHLCRRTCLATRLDVVLFRNLRKQTCLAVCEGV